MNSFEDVVKINIEKLREEYKKYTRNPQYQKKILRQIKANKELLGIIKVPFFKNE